MRYDGRKAHSSFLRAETADYYGFFPNSTPTVKAALPVTGTAIQIISSLNICGPRL